MKLTLVTLILVIFNQAETFGQVSQIAQEKSTGSAKRLEPIPEYIDDNFKSLILLEYHQALDSLEKTVSDKELAYYTAWCHFINGQMFDAYEDINEYLNHTSSKNRYYGQILLAKIQFARLNKYQPIEALDKAISIEPTKPYAYLEKSRIYALTKNVEEGLGFTDQCIKQFPGEGNFYLNRALLLSGSDNPKKAIENFNFFLTSATRRDSSDLMLVYFGLGKSYLQAKDYINALDQTTLGLQMFPDYSPGYGLRGEINFRLKDYDSSLKDFKKMEEKMQASSYWKMIANIYEIKGDMESACGYYNEQCRLLRDAEACAKLRKLKCRTLK
jgi:tetratricopeptide (TPR) repeat protein